MNTDRPHDILREDAMAKMAKLLKEQQAAKETPQRRYVPLTEEEAKLLEGKSEEERREWLGKMPFKEYWDRLKAADAQKGE